MFDALTPADIAKIDSLAAIFTRIGDERMKEIGLYNHALKVQAIGFRPWEGWLAGVLVTPWFMNFMLLPCRDGQIGSTETGSKRRIELPCGETVFTQGEVEEIGPYLAASLYSPMGRFDVHDMAVATGWAAVEKFFKVPEVDEPGGPVKP
jgi:[NiFe] hydrogenase assembly HybE family chaperone